MTCQAKSFALNRESELYGLNSPLTLAIGSVIDQCYFPGYFSLCTLPVTSGSRYWFARTCCLSNLLLHCAYYITTWHRGPASRSSNAMGCRTQVNNFGFMFLRGNHHIQIPETQRPLHYSSWFPWHTEFCTGSLFCAAGASLSTWRSQHHQLWWTFTVHPHRDPELPLAFLEIFLKLFRTHNGALEKCCCQFVTCVPPGKASKAEFVKLYTHPDLWATHSSRPSLPATTSLTEFASLSPHPKSYMSHQCIQGAPSGPYHG